MGVPLRLENFLLDNNLSFQRFAEFEVSDEILAKIDGLLARVGRMGKEVDRLFQDVTAQGMEYARFVEQARDEVPNGGPENLESLIRELSEIEARYAAELGPRIKRSRKYLASVRKDDALVSAGLLPIIQKEIEAMTQAIEQIRDTRWQLMAVKAEVVQTAPTQATSDPGELRAMLKRLKH